MVAGGWLVAAAFGTVAGTAGLLRYLWQYRAKPGADWFLASLACQALWSGTYGVALLVTAPTIRWVLEVLMLGLLTGLSLFFGAFALEYTGRGRLRSRSARVLLALSPVGAALVAATNPVHGLFWTGYRLAPVAGLATVDYAFEPLALLFGTLAVLTPAVGSLLLFDTVVSYGPLYRREAVAVGLSTVPPTAAFVVWLYSLGPLPAVNFAPMLFVPHVLLDAYAFVGSDMFEFHPATRRAGERAAIDDLGSPVVIVDERGRIVTLNAAAESVLGVEKAAVLTDPLDGYLDGETVDPAAGDQRLSVRTGGTERTYSVTATPLDDGRGSLVGYTLVWQDVTDAIRREQRLAVLNRVLRHNLRNDLTVVRGYAEAAADTVDDESVMAMLDSVVGKADDLAALGATARDVETLLAGDPRPEPVALDALLSAVVADARDATPAATVALECPAVTVNADRKTLRTVCAELVDNAVTHAGPEPSVAVSVTTGPEGVAVSVADDGPGLPKNELAVVESGEETPLEHGSGLGLWLVRWGSRRLGAELSFDVSGDGTTATLTLPAA